MRHHIFSGILFKKQTTNSTRSLIRHQSETGLTAVIWLLSVGLIVVTGQQTILALSSVSAFKESILFYGLSLALISAMTIAWSFFRLFRYKKRTTKNQKKSDKPRRDELGELVRFFKLAPELIEELRRSNCVNVQFRTTEAQATFPMTLLEELKHDHTIYLFS